MKKTESNLQKLKERIKRENKIVNVELINADEKNMTNNDRAVSFFNKINKISS